MSCTRRKFLEQSGWLVVAGTCGSLLPMLFQGCGPARLVQASVVDGKITVDRTLFTEPGFVLVQAERLQAPIYVGRTTNAPVSAVLMLCTHKGCVLEPAGNYLTCPCHGSEFSAAGKLIKEPALTDLKSYRITENEQHVIIHIA